MKQDDDVLEELERIDRFFDGDEAGEVPLDVLRARGIDVPDDDASLEDEALHVKLWEIIEALASMGMVLEQTDHLSDRELYRWLVLDALLEETILSDNPASTWHVSPIGSWSDDDVHTHLRYYADDQERSEWQVENGCAPPPRASRPADRDRLLPTPESRLRADA